MIEQVPSKSYGHDLIQFCKRYVDFEICLRRWTEGALLR